MIIKKYTKDNKVTAFYNSSNVLSSVYDNDKHTLEVTFKRGARYLYENVDKTDYFRFELADSQGQVFNSHIKKYTALKLDAVNPESIETEIKQYNELEVTNIVSAVVDRVLSIISSSDTYSSPSILTAIIKECNKGVELAQKFTVDE